MQGVTAEYGPARAQKNQTGKWYPQIPVDHTTLQINQRVVNTTLIPVKYKHWAQHGARNRQDDPPQLWRSAPCRLRRQALSAISVAIGLKVRILDPSREFYAARLASGNQPTMVDVSAG